MLGDHRQLCEGVGEMSPSVRHSLPSGEQQMQKMNGKTKREAKNLHDFLAPHSLDGGWNRLLNQRAQRERERERDRVWSKCNITSSWGSSTNTDNDTVYKGILYGHSGASSELTNSDNVLVLLSLNPEPVLGNIAGRLQNGNLLMLISSP